MKNQKQKAHKLNRVVMVLLSPVMSILWLIGWSLYWTSSRKQLTKSAKSGQNEDEDLTFTVLMTKQQHLE